MRQREQRIVYHTGAHSDISPPDAVKGRGKSQQKEDVKTKNAPQQRKRQ